MKSATQVSVLLGDLPFSRHPILLFFENQWNCTQIQTSNEAGKKCLATALAAAKLRCGPVWTIPSSSGPALPEQDKARLDRLPSARQIAQQGIPGQNFPGQDLKKSMSNEEELKGRVPEGPGNIMAVLFWFFQGGKQNFRA